MTGNIKMENRKSVRPKLSACVNCYVQQKYGQMYIAANVKSSKHTIGIRRDEGDKSVTNQSLDRIN